MQISELPTSLHIAIHNAPAHPLTRGMVSRWLGKSVKASTVDEWTRIITEENFGLPQSNRESPDVPAYDVMVYGEFRERGLVPMERCALVDTYATLTPREILTGDMETAQRLLAERLRALDPVRYNHPQLYYASPRWTPISVFPPDVATTVARDTFFINMSIWEWDRLRALVARHLPQLAAEIHAQQQQTQGQPPNGPVPAQ